jgi:hypothetical protein
LLSSHDPKSKTPDYPPGNLTFYLGQLITADRGALIKYDTSSGRYSFSDPIYRAFALTLLESEEEKSEEVIQVQLDKEKFERVFKELLTEITASWMKKAQKD